jgi:NADP-dependent 3-hydroxy acid dehydrogenase YdfG
MGEEMTYPLRNKVVAIPLSVTPIGSAVSRLVADAGGGLALGVPALAQLEAAERSVDPRHGVYAQHVDLDRPRSVAEFFEIVIGQFGHLDVVVVETVGSRSRNGSGKIIEVSSRRLLNCLDAALRYVETDLHVINIAPVAGRFAIPVATAFIAAKLATAKAPSAPRIRMSTISKSGSVAPADASLARTVLHLIKEAHSPDITEAVLRRPPVTRHGTAKPGHHGRAKIAMQM